MSDMTETNVIPFEIGYAGTEGKRRAEFCLKFAARKQTVFDRINSDIRAKVIATGETVTCRKGCSECCVHYIEANIQECDAIAYHLYQNHDMANQFVIRYARWRASLQQLGGAFLTCDSFLHGDCPDGSVGGVQDDLVQVLGLYSSQRLPCPFLDAGACSIYDVRPYVCANHLVTTPSERCRPPPLDAPASVLPHVYMTEADEIYDRRYCDQTLRRPVIGFAPTIVFRILTEGNGFLRSVGNDEPGDALAKGHYHAREY